MASDNESLERTRRHRARLSTRASRLTPVAGWIVSTLVAATAVLALGAGFAHPRDRGDPMTGTEGTTLGMQPGPMQPTSPTVTFPPMQGFYEGKTVLFIHPEASDAKVAKLLTRMMRSPVIVVPGLAKVPAAALADVYVFTNGVKGQGQLGFQLDVFDSAPRDRGYSPLRALNLVTWREGAKARLFKSAAEVKRAAASGDVRIERSGVVVNMPFLTWPGGKR